ncbi:MAG: YraN family protein [Anaerolineales bacterium]|nr:YraN family protein [Anaerolineales bacterium]
MGDDTMVQALGSWGEEQAVRFLLRNGYRVIERNFRVWEGEIDVITERDGRIVFVEVKTRSSDLFGSPEESLSSRKQIRLYRAGCRYLELKSLLDKPFQFDLIAIECTPSRQIERFTHYEDIVCLDSLE